jgi:hypothetical protein
MKTDLHLGEAEDLHKARGESACGRFPCLAGLPHA